MLTYLTFFSDATSPRLTPAEVDTLARFTFDVAQAGKLTEGTYIGGTKALYWERMKGGN